MPSAAATLDVCELVRASSAYPPLPGLDKSPDASSVDRRSWQTSPREALQEAFNDCGMASEVSDTGIFQRVSARQCLTDEVKSYSLLIGMPASVGTQASSSNRKSQENGPEKRREILPGRSQPFPPIGADGNFCVTSLATGFLWRGLSHFAPRYLRRRKFEAAFGVPVRIDGVSSLPTGNRSTDYPSSGFPCVIGAGSGQLRRDGRSISIRPG